ncbi:MAG: flagellar biosynthetic protein FliO [Porticoccaceae bacterium]|nr:flagellar biosynthetic protein FliO [Porticoccaceae bacterium]
MKAVISISGACLLLCSVALASPEDAGEDAVSQVEQPADNSKSPVARSERPRTLSGSDKSPNGSYVLQLIASLLVVLVAFAVLAWLVKRFNRLPGRSGSHMQVLGAMSLGARERAVLVQVGTTQMLLGVSTGRVATLHVFDEPVVEVEQGAASGVNFGAILSNLGKGGQS